MEYHTSSITKSAQETADVAGALADHVSKAQKGSGSGATVVCLYGALGSGKTTFVQGFAKALGVTRRLLSPTFIIVRHYPIADKNIILYHLDLYRLSRADLPTLSIGDMLADPAAYMLIEWAEKLGSLLPTDRIDVHCEALEGGSHRIEIDNIYGNN